MKGLHELEAENALLGALLNLATVRGHGEATEALTDLRAILPPRAFFFHPNRVAYEVMCVLADAGRNFDSISLSAALADAGHADLAGHVHGSPQPNAYLFVNALFTHNAVSVPSLPHHAQIIREKFVRRELEQVCSDTLKSLHEEQDRDVQRLLEQTQERVLSVAEANAPADNFRGPKQGVFNAMNRLYEAYEHRGGISGLPSGLIDLDRMTTGWKKSQMIVVCGSTGMGKTALMLQFAAHIALKLGKPVGYFSLEMDYDELVERALYSEARVSLQRARDGHLSEVDLERFQTTAVKVAGAPLYIDDWSGLNVLEMQARARHAVKKLGCVALFGDYLQLFEGMSDREDNRVQELARVSRGIKLCAKSNKVPFIVGAQLNRKPDERASQVVVNPYVIGDDQRPMRFKRYGVPQLGDLRECGAIGQDADIVLGPYRPWYWSKDDNDRAEQHIEWATLFVLKQRNGPVGPVHVQFVDDETRFVTLPDSNGNPRENLYSTVLDKQQPGYEAKHAKKEES